MEGLILSLESLSLSTRQGFCTAAQRATVATMRKKGPCWKFFAHGFGRVIALLVALLVVRPLITIRPILVTLLLSILPAFPFVLLRLCVILGLLCAAS